MDTTTNEQLRELADKSRDTLSKLSVLPATDTNILLLDIVGTQISIINLIADLLIGDIK